MADTRIEWLLCLYILNFLKSNCFPINVKNLPKKCFWEMWSNSFEHDFIEDESAAEQTLSPPKSVDKVLLKSEKGITVWNAKVLLFNPLIEIFISSYYTYNSIFYFTNWWTPLPSVLPVNLDLNTATVLCLILILWKRQQLTKLILNIYSLCFSVTWEGS